MPRFNYTARAGNGELSQGTIEAATRKEAMRMIGMRGLRPVSLREPTLAGVSANGGGASAKEGAHLGKKFFSLFSRSGETAAGAARPNGATVLKGIGRRQRLPFLRALSELVASGMPVGDAVRLLSMRLKDPQLKLLARGLWERVSGGLSISDAMLDVPDVFDRSTVYLVESGEATGNLREILDRLVGYFEEQKELQSKIVAAMAYPLLLLVVACGLVAFAVFFLLPRLETMLASLGGRMPATTRILVAGAEFTVTQGPFILVGMILAGIGLWQWKRTAKGALAWDRLCLKIPVFGKFLLTTDVLQITQTMSVLLENGVTTIETLRMTENVISNRAIRAAFSDARQKVVEGRRISQALQSTGYIPQTVLDMMAVGEETGNIVNSLKQIARIYQKTLAQQLRAFIGVLSIAVLIGVFAFVGFIAIAIISAVFEMSASFSR